MTGTWTVKDIRPNAEGKAQKVKVKVRINLHGIMTVLSASMFEAKESTENDTVEENQQKEQDTQTQKQQNSTDAQSTPQNDIDAPMDDAANTTATSTAPEVGSGTSWTKKISNWFSGVRILTRHRLAWQKNLLCVPQYYIFIRIYSQTIFF